MTNVLKYSYTTTSEEVAGPGRFTHTLAPLFVAPNGN
jgi:hypothetical protein